MCFVILFTFIYYFSDFSVEKNTMLLFSTNDMTIVLNGAAKGFYFITSFVITLT